MQWYIQFLISANITLLSVISFMFTHRDTAICLCTQHDLKVIVSHRPIKIDVKKLLL